MRSHRLKILSVVILFSSFALNAMQTSCDNLSVAYWLLGEWQDQRSEVVVTEVWHKVSDETYEGVGTTYSKAKQTTSTESMRLVTMLGQVFFIAKVSSNDKPVAFKLTTCNAKKLVFENPQHDFPKKLDYHLLQPDRIQVLVSGEPGQGFSITYKKK